MLFNKKVLKEAIIYLENRKNTKIDNQNNAEKSLNLDIQILI